jgi:ketosteroid isomerase-like protein
MRFGSLLTAAVVSLAVFAPVGFTARADEKAAQGWDTLVDSERAFSRLSEEKGTKASSVAHFVEDVLTFPPSAATVTGTAFLNDDKPESGVLTWRPIRAEIAASGDFGYTTGPYERRESVKHALPVSQGSYVSVWKRNPAGAWKVIATFSSESPPPQAGEQAKDKIESYRRAAERLHPAPPASFKNKAEAAAYTRANDSALEADTAFGARAKAKGYPASFIAVAAPDVILYRPGQRPITGSKAVKAALPALGKVVAWKPAGVAAAASGDLAFTHGTAGITTQGSPEARKLKYLHLWRRENVKKPWRLVLEIANAATPEASPTKQD